MYYESDSAVSICVSSMTDETCLKKLKKNINHSNFHKPDRFGCTAISKAMEKYYYNSFKFLLDHIDVNKYNHGLSHLHLAVLTQNKTAVEILLTHPDINIYYGVSDANTKWSGWIPEELHFNHRMHLSSVKLEIGVMLKQARIKDRKKFQDIVFTLTYCLGEWEEVNVPMEMIREIAKYLRPSKGVPKSLRYRKK
jgi:hypothetical protein